MNKNLYRMGHIVIMAVIAICFAALPLGSGSEYISAQTPSCHDNTTGHYVRLAEWEFDPLCQPEPIYLPANLRLTDYAPGQNGYYLVQFQGPILPEWKEAVSKTGAVLLDYLPDFTFIARMTPAIRDEVASLPMVRWVGIYQPGYRLAPALLEQALGTVEPDTMPQEFIVLVFPDENSKVITSQIQAAGIELVESSSNEGGTLLRIRATLTQASLLAHINGVRWVEPFYERKLTNDVARSNAIMGAESIWSNLGLYGTGQIVAVADTGLDTGNLSTLAQDFLGTPTGCAGNNRIIATYALGRTNNWSDSCQSGGVNYGGHGTHVSGSILGNGCRSGSNGNPNYSGSYAGLAPQAGLVMQSVMDSSCELGGLPADLNTLFNQARTAGARIHSNSWGAAVHGQYTTDSYNTDLFSWNNKDYTILFSAGNDGVDASNDGVVDLDSLGAPATAKNCITVGASENNRASGGINPGSTVCSGDPGACSPPNAAKYGNCWPSDYQASPVCPDLLSNNIAGMAAFSSRGPTHDDRTKPDIVAPGTNILSTKSQGTYVSNGWGAGPNQYYQYMGGTSMSTPLTAGAVALIRQFYNNIKGLINPSAALLKATLVNGATDIYPGQYGTGATQEIPTTRPNNVEGWGRVNLPESLIPTAPRVLDYFDFVNDGLYTNEWDTVVLKMSATQTFRTTLAWTDYPGALAAGGGLVNDLDLEVVAPNSTVYYPNNANRRGVTQYLHYDDAPAGVDNSYTNYRYAVRFTPTSYPVNVRRGLMYAYATAYPVTYRYWVFDDDGSGGAPGTILYGPATVRVAGQGWSAMNISGVTINSGSFYIAWQPLAANAPSVVYDGTASSGRSWYYNGSSWINKWPPTGVGRDLNIQAIVSAPDYSTNHDRVNNLVGIDINTPPQTGNYTIKVSGYNVPQAPQPYALVTTAAAEFSGAASYRIFASGNTAARTFGRTGVTVDFASSPGGNVTVNMFKDYPPYPPTGSLTFMKVNWDISTSMAGSFNAQLVFHYDEADLPPGMSEAEIQGVYRYDGSKWVGPQGSVNTNANTITVDNVTAFSNWTAGKGSPTAVTLSHFEAIAKGNAIRLEWETASELNTAGFNLHRSTAPDGTYEKLNDALIPPHQPGSLIGATYVWTDTNVLPGVTYYYRLEDVDTQGSSGWYGPVAARTATPVPTSTVFLPLVMRQQ